ncbi:MAG: DNA methylase, partial [Akkermansia sp.]
MPESAYIAIDLKSFYASVECVERGLDPLDTHLVVADESRTDKTICLAVTPPLKACGLPGRPRLFEVRQKQREVNREREQRARSLSGSSASQSELRRNPRAALDVLIAPPRMAHYIRYSTRIYSVYTRYISPEHIVVYSIDEVFLDVAPYLDSYRCTPRELAKRIILDILRSTGITATAGIGSNLYLAKVAMDIVAKHIAPDADGTRIAELDETNYRRRLWAHRPLTDFWRVGRGYARKLEQNGLLTMGDIARRSLRSADSLYRLFGKNAELLIDHAWGWEPCTVQDIKAYRPENRSLGSGQVLHEPYSADKALLVLREMTDQLALELVEKGLLTDHIVITVGYDIENLRDPQRRRQYRGPVSTDAYGRRIPAHAHGSRRLERLTSSARLLRQSAQKLAQELIDPALLVRRLNIVAARVVSENAPTEEPPEPHQLELFAERDTPAAQEEERERLAREHRMQQALLHIRRQFGNNA